MFEQLGEHVEKGVLGVENPEVQGLTDATANSEGVKNPDRRGSLDPGRDSALSKFQQTVGRLKEKIKSCLDKIFRWNFGQPKNQHGIDSQTRQTETLQGQPTQESSSEGGQQPDGSKISRREFLKNGVVVLVLAVCYGYYNRIGLARLVDKLLFSHEKLLEGVSFSELLVYFRLNS